MADLQQRLAVSEAKPISTTENAAGIRGTWKTKKWYKLRHLYPMEMAQVSSMLGAADLAAIRLERLRVTVTGFAQRGYSGALEFHEDEFPTKNETYLKPNGTVDSRLILKSLAEHWEGIDRFIELPTTYLLLQFEYGIIRGVKINDVKALRE